LKIFCNGSLAGRTGNKTPPLPCAIVPVNFGNMRDGTDGFRRPVKVSATIAACVPDRVNPIQGPYCESRAGQENRVFNASKTCRI
jgi:hypothetical protein